MMTESGNAPLDSKADLGQPIAGVVSSASVKCENASAVAAQRWIHEHGDVLWKFSIIRTGSKEAAEDIVQETLLSAMQGYSTFVGLSSERTWLLGIAAHKIAGHFRRLRRASGRGVADMSADAACTCTTCQGMFTDKGSWACVAKVWPDHRQSESEKTEQLAALRACIDLLPPGQAQVVWLRDILEVPSVEVCKVMGLSDTNLWTRMHRARVALRSCLETRLGLRKEKKT
jgi:RNA polymerase sigma-70 factor, ECF subfamily